MNLLKTCEVGSFAACEVMMLRNFWD